MPPVLVTTDDPTAIFSQIGTVSYLLFTANSYINRRSGLTMGRGFARQMRDRFDGIDQYFGRRIETWEAHNEWSPYGLLILPFSLDTWDAGKTRFGAFQVKKHYKEDADLSLVTLATKKLRQLLIDEQHETVAMNFPAIGNGGLHYDKVWPIVKRLPDRVTLYTLEQ